MNENDKQVFERMQASRIELEQKLLAELIGFEWKWGIKVDGIWLARVDVTNIAGPAASALVQVNIESKV